MKYKFTALVVTCLFLFSIFSGCTTVTTKDKNTVYVNVNGGADYKSIQEAINESPENFTISVSPGVYYENILINRSITLIGSTAENTIIDANGSGDVITITEQGTLNISRFTLRNSGGGYTHSDYDAAIDISSDHNRFDQLIIMDNEIGVYSTNIAYNNFSNNTIHSNSNYGIYFYSSSNNNILKDNLFTNNSCALRIKGARYNQIIRNIFEDNQRGMYFCCGAQLNTVYHNTFKNNSLWHGNDYVNNNDWDNGYPSGGNYWDDYEGNDDFTGENQNISGSDGIGDTPYNVTSDGDKQDYYPLMEPKAIE